VGAAPKVSGLVRPTQKSKRQSAMVLVTVNAVELAETYRMEEKVGQNGSMVHLLYVD
jgi:hypothetical protein